jgi:hypothetical protein
MTSPPNTPESTSASATSTTAHSTTDMDDYSWCQSSYESEEDRGRSGASSPPPTDWSPPPLSRTVYQLRLPSPDYVPRTPTPRPPVPDAALSPLSFHSPEPLELEYPMQSPVPLSPPIRDESLSPVIPSMPPSSPPDSLVPPWMLWTP